MRPGIRGRIERLPWCDRLSLLMVFGYSAAGLAVNYRTGGVWRFSVLGVIILFAMIAGVIAYSVIRQQRRLTDYGFSLKRGGVVSLAGLAAIHVYLVISGKFVLSAPANFGWIVLAAFLEELVFRVVAIDTLILLMDGIKAKAFWAVLASSVLWSIPHIPTKFVSQLLGIFLGGLVFGWVYYKSRSILLPAWLHVAANGGYLCGILIAGAYCLISLAELAMWGSRRQPPPATAASKNMDAIHLDA